ncbi:putative pyruvate dehydrogenase E1 component, beta subunit [Acrocarpospora pleiomorpha]|uniref:Putative pyruvate dehydrogenase E1 component, beta subunit n=1 Tax=Acrocarpospora pleiomorpha TaxID=90975 RepID=A0A5M3XYP0_9ACTN|nr:alpha-ketoacid dehydrogenase subunit beta [Acrocarpospora pleiomorpha]GES24691.1 putative pyruvate dehydrogenase E1 component, beta subunit [Acrocarpospora pleiomorpha]
MSEWSMQRALNEALRTSLREDARTLIFGEDVGRHGGVFRVTDGLQRSFGDRQVFDTPLAEAGIVGAAVGLCMRGWRPVVELQFDGFSYPAFNQVASHVARLRTRSRGAFHLPLTIRVPSFGGIKGPELHSESTEALYAHLPGIKVVSPSTPADAYALLLQAIRDPDPVVFLEPKSRYWSTGPVPTEADLDSELYSSRLARAGRHVTLLSWGASVARCLQAADFAAEDGVEVEVVDLRWLKPIDVPAIAASVRKTRRAVVVEEAQRSGGLGAEVSALLMEHCFSDLRAPVVRVAAPDVPYPSGSFEDAFLPTPDRILTAIQSTFGAA